MLYKLDIKIVEFICISYANNLFEIAVVSTKFPSASIFKFFVPIEFALIQGSPGHQSAVLF